MSFLNVLGVHNTFDVFRSSTNFYTFISSLWIPPGNIDNVKAYQLRTAAPAVSFNYTGLSASCENVSLVTGVNWFPYLLHQTSDVESALGTSLFAPRPA